MAKNFDDFILWEREDPDASERGHMLTENVIRALERNKTGPEMMMTMITFIDDMITERLRSYHEWVNR